MTDPTHQHHRQEYLDWLFRRAGRGAKTHPMRGLYTGLFAARLRELLDQDMERSRAEP